MSLSLPTLTIICRWFASSPALIVECSSTGILPDRLISKRIAHGSTSGFKRIVEDRRLKIGVEPVRCTSKVLSLVIESSSDQGIFCLVNSFCQSDQ